MGQTVTGPIALIKVNGITIGKIRDIRATENYSRAETRGIGSLQALEAPMIGFNGTFSIDAFFVDLRSSGIKQLLNRETVSLQQFVNTVLLNESGIDIYIYKKIPKTVDDTTRLVTAVDEDLLATLTKCFLDSTNFNISEGQISTYSQSGRFLDPIILNQ